VQDATVGHRAAGQDDRHAAFHGGGQLLVVDLVDRQHHGSADVAGNPAQQPDPRHGQPVEHRPHRSTQP